MSQPFSPQVATQLIREAPGRTTEEIVEDALNRGIIGSRARDPLASQMGALVKMYLAGRLSQVWRDESQQPYRWYPKTDPVLADSTPQVISFRPTSRQERVITALASALDPVRVTSRVADEADRVAKAVRWLLDQGISANSDLIDQALAARSQIEALQKKMQVPGE